MSVVVRGGKVLLGEGGKVATNPDCCCGGPCDCLPCSDLDTQSISGPTSVTFDWTWDFSSYGCLREDTTLSGSASGDLNNGICGYVFSSYWSSCWESNILGCQVGFGQDV